LYDEVQQIDGDVKKLHERIVFFVEQNESIDEQIAGSGKMHCCSAKLRCLIALRGKIPGLMPISLDSKLFSASSDFCRGKAFR